MHLKDKQHLSLKHLLQQEIARYKHLKGIVEAEIKIVVAAAAAVAVVKVAAVKVAVVRVAVVRVAVVRVAVVGLIAVLEGGLV